MRGVALHTAAPVPVEGDCVLVQDRAGCRACKKFGPAWDSYMAHFSDTLFSTDESNTDPSYKKYLETGPGHLPRIMIVSSEGHRPYYSQELSDALVAFITKSSENDHTDEVFVSNMGRLASSIRGGGLSRERRALSKFHKSLVAEHSFNVAIGAISEKYGGVPEDLLERDTEALPSDTVSTSSEPLNPVEVADPVAGEVGSILDHLSLEDDYSYGNGGY